ncbi:uncharacterized protein LOC112494735 isoform X2 [Cephus cinctus]|uniref:Uncharacterized protein LOC112494735 isoform X2 n=1 Tax=Cephus cinctus TaxID=211228 RepID=A0AAJ7W3P2_CEPCN|nr:uncharacterized protein LOC112494735 isoform X2 [Cephus cinctus]
MESFEGRASWCRTCRRHSGDINRYCCVGNRRKGAMDLALTEVRDVLASTSLGDLTIVLSCHRRKPPGGARVSHDLTLINCNRSVGQYDGSSRDDIVGQEGTMIWYTRGHPTIREFSTEDSLNILYQRKRGSNGNAGGTSVREWKKLLVDKCEI